MEKSKQELYKQEAEKSRNKFNTSFYYVDPDKAERLGLLEYKATVGDKFIRIISPNLDEFWAKEIFKHTNIGANRATFLCLDKMFGKECPICEMIKELREKDSKDPNIAALRYQRRYLVFLYDVENSETERKGLRWYDMPVTVKDNIMSLCEDKRSGKFTEVEHPKDGKDIEFRRVGTTQEGTRYSAFKLVVESEPLPKGWIEDVPQFEEVLNIPKFETIEEELLGVAAKPSKETETEKDEKDEKEEKEEQRAPRGERSRSRNREEKEKVETEVEEEEPRSRRESRERSEGPSGDEKESRRERARQKAQALKDKLANRKEAE